MKFNTDLQAQVAIIGHAIFNGDTIKQFVRPGIDDQVAMFANWGSGAAIFTRVSPEGRRQVKVITLYRLAPNSDQRRLAELLMLDFADNPTTGDIGRTENIKLATVAFDSHAIPVPLVGKVAENIYAQLYHQYHDGSTS